ncbi:MAG: AAA family ATPase, partial [Actinomycetota bacterium]
MKRKIMAALQKWKDKSDKQPLILYGARQVGKTHIIKEFGKTNYENVIYVNFETNQRIASFFDEDIAPARIIRYLESSFNEEIFPHKTLIVFDEIQVCERALTSLKYFCEQTPEYHIVAAGSLLGVAINREKYSFPVGKVESLSLYP